MKHSYLLMLLECFKLLWRRVKLYTSMEHLIISQKITFAVFMSFFCKRIFKRNMDHRYFAFLLLNFRPSKCSSFLLTFNQFNFVVLIKFVLNEFLLSVSFFFSFLISFFEFCNFSSQEHIPQKCY